MSQKLFLCLLLVQSLNFLPLYFPLIFLNSCYPVFTIQQCPGTTKNGNNAVWWLILNIAIFIPKINFETHQKKRQSIKQSHSNKLQKNLSWFSDAKNTIRKDNHSTPRSGCRVKQIKTIHYKIVQRNTERFCTKIKWYHSAWQFSKDKGSNTINFGIHSPSWKITTCLTLMHQCFPAESQISWKWDFQYWMKRQKCRRIFFLNLDMVPIQFQKIPRNKTCGIFFHNNAWPSKWKWFNNWNILATQKEVRSAIDKLQNTEAADIYDLRGYNLFQKKFVGHKVESVDKVPLDKYNVATQKNLMRIWTESILKIVPEVCTSLKIILVNKLMSLTLNKIMTQKLLKFMELWKSLWWTKPDGDFSVSWNSNETQRCDRCLACPHGHKNDYAWCWISYWYINPKCESNFTISYDSRCCSSNYWSVWNTKTFYAIVAHSHFKNNIKGQVRKFVETLPFELGESCIISYLPAHVASRVFFLHRMNL